MAYNYETIIFLNNQLQEVENGELKMTNAKFNFSKNLMVNNIDSSDVSAKLVSLNSNPTGANLSAFSGWSNFSGKGGFGN